MTKSMNARARRHEAGTIWHNSDPPERRAAPPSRILPADIAMQDPVQRSVEPETRPTLLHRVCRVFDAMITASSMVSNEPVLDVRDFDWTPGLRREWSAIREEVLARPPLPPKPSHCGILSLWRRGDAVADADTRYPRTIAALRAVPGLHDAAFALLPPGTHVAARRGVTKGLITCHLGLVVPRDGGARMRVRDRIVRWAEGETLVFDDSYEHEIWNEAVATRIVLHLRVVRPLRQPGRWIAHRILRLSSDGIAPEERDGRA